MDKSLIIGIAGGSGSGKSTLVRALGQLIPEGKLSVLAQDSYYKDLGYLPRKERITVNFDHPDSIDFDLMCEHVQELRRGRQALCPVYSFHEETRTERTEKVYPRPVIIVEGILILCHEELRSLLDFSIFVDTPADLRLLRRIQRDVEERGHDLKGVCQRYQSAVRPMYEQFVGPSRAFADFIVSGESPAENLAERLVNRLIQP
jgi:uridine kinase